MKEMKSLPKTAIIIVSYNACHMMQYNIESIRNTLQKDTYHIYVVDNASTDGIEKWLRVQAEEFDDISVVFNEENVGFPKACNQGVELSVSEGDTESDVFLLNNDTRLCKNSLMNLKDALYSSDEIGAVSGISNYAGNNQQLDINFSLPMNYVEYGNNVNVPANEYNYNDLWEERVRLNGFAMLIKRRLWDETGGMDEAYSPGFIEDDDISMKITSLRKRLLVCHNSFIYHAGSQSFSKMDNVNQLFIEHYNIFLEKYGVDIVKYAYSHNYYKSRIPFDLNDKFSALVIGSGVGADIKYLRSKYRNASVIGVEHDDVLRNWSGHTEIVYKNIAGVKADHPKEKFDIVISNSEGLLNVTEEDLSALDTICSNNCILLDQPENDTEIIQYRNLTDNGDDKCKADILPSGHGALENVNTDIIAYDTLIMTTAADYTRLERLYPRMLSTIPAKAICFVGSKEVGDLVESSGLGPRLGFVNENDILTFDEVHAVMTDALKDILDGRELPRGVTGWYYQQFLKMAYSRICQDEYYLVWDGDTVPCSKFSMFKEGTVTPYFDLKTECHEEYFVTLSKLIPGMGKVIKKSFISEHMLIKTEFMKELIAVIESNNGLKGNTFYEKIIYVIEPEKLLSNSFSEFETYGTYVALRHMSAYMLRDWHSFRYGGAFFDMNTISESDFEWLSHDFNAITFEKGHEVREDHKNLFDNKEYQSKLTARQMLEIAQEEFKGDSFIESWD